MVSGFVSCPGSNYRTRSIPRNIRWTITKFNFMASHAGKTLEGEREREREGTFADTSVLDGDSSLRVLSFFPPVSHADPTQYSIQKTLERLHTPYFKQR